MGSMRSTRGGRGNPLVDPVEEGRARHRGARELESEARLRHAAQGTRRRGSEVAGQVPGAGIHVDLALHVTPQPDVLVAAAALELLGWTREVLLLTDGRFDEANDAIKEAWRLVENTEPSKVRARVLAVLARCVQNDIHESRAYAEAAIADARTAGSASAQADALITLAYTDLREGRADEACDLLVRAAGKAAEAGAHEVELRAKFDLCVNEYELGRLDRAATAADDGVARATEVGLTWSPFGRALRWMQVMAHYARGDWDRAAAAATPPDEQVSDTISALIAAAGGLIQAGRGQFDAAKRMFAKVRPESTRVIDLVQFTDAAAIDPIYVERPYYLAPDGSVLTAPDAAAIDALVEKVVRSGATAAAVSLLHAYANPIHELALGDRLRRRLPYVSLSHRVNPEEREYERTSAC